MELWKEKAKWLPGANSVREVILAAPEAIAKKLGIRVVRAPSIAGGDEIAGYLDRKDRRIEISVGFPYLSQRFTFGHELGHWALHTGNDYFRDRAISAPGTGARPYFELEADVFAAELLMPKKHLIGVFEEIFGEPIDGAIPNRALADGVSAGRERSWNPMELASTSPFDRAMAIGRAGFYRGRHFVPLTEYFKVSQTAMAIRLLETELVA